LVLGLVPWTPASARERQGGPTLAERAAKLPWWQTPVLPSPDRGTYAPESAPPRDPLVGALLAERTPDTRLEAAAAALALLAVEGKGGLARWELREAAWRAGWPYPVTAAQGWGTPEGAPPPPELFAWIEALSPDQVFGLARARGPNGDAWVGLLGQPAVALGAVPRTAPLGTLLTLPKLPGATLRLADGRGTLREESLADGATVPLVIAGEWIARVEVAGTAVAHFPIYAGIPTPQVALLRADEDASAVTTSEEVDAHARALLREVRLRYVLPAWGTDPLLDAAARALAQDPTRAADPVLERMGAAPGRGVAWRCDDLTVEDCLDRWVWNPSGRQALLDPGLDRFGLDARLDATGVHLVLTLAPTATAP
jgi:hypothetical protein